MIPANWELHVIDHTFSLQPISKPHEYPEVITIFMRSLAEHWSGQIFAVIVSGLGDDGASAMAAIKAVGGITIAQTPKSAAHPDMPRSAIKTTHVDFVLSPEEIAHLIGSSMSPSGSIIGTRDD